MEETPTERNLLAGIAEASAISDRSQAASTIASLIRSARHYRWVGIYEVGVEEIYALAWSGPNAPAYPVFPRGSGLCGRAVAAGTVVCVDDVTKDPDYLTTLSSTRSEMVVPILDSSQKTVGVIDVESEHVDAFSGEDISLISRCASAASVLWS
jgi:L-methionine (R)-S-oxide reductase